MPGYGGLVTWGGVFGPCTVDASEGAFSWVFRDFMGEVRSASGDAFPGCYGTAVGRVQAGNDALAWVVGDFLGSVEADGYSGAVVLGDFHGDMDAGASGFILAQGVIDGSLTAGEDAWLWAIGNVNATVTAGHDAAAIGYGNLTLTLSAGQDVSYLWARGDLSGTITAGRNVGFRDFAYYYEPGEGPIFSYGSDITDLLAEYAAVKTQAVQDSRTAVDQAIQDVTAANGAARAKTADWLIHTIADAQVALRNQANAAAAAVNAARANAAIALADLNKQVDAAYGNMTCILQAAESARKAVLKGLDALDKQMLAAQTKGWAASAEQCLAREQVWNKLVREIEEAIYGRRWDRLQLLLSIGSILALGIPYVGPYVSAGLCFWSGCISVRRDDYLSATLDFLGAAVLPFPCSLHLLAKRTSARFLIVGSAIQLVPSFATSTVQKAAYARWQLSQDHSRRKRAGLSIPARRASRCICRIRTAIFSQQAIRSRSRRRTISSIKARSSQSGSSLRLPLTPFARLDLGPTTL